jgi:hypothetical protein
MIFSNFFSKTEVPKAAAYTTFSVNTMEQLVKKTESQVETYVLPIRQTIFKRYPTLFTLLVTTGVAATFLGLEEILLRFSALREYPELILLIGLSILVFTGHLYKKLS